MFLPKPRLLVGSLVVLTSVALATGCFFYTNSPAPEEEPGTARKRIQEITPEIRDMVKANSDFALDLYARLAQQNQAKNLFFSPYSLSSALAMVAEGARSETAEEMGKVLRYSADARNKGEDARLLPWDMNRIHTGMSALNDHFLSGAGSAPRSVQDKLAALRRELQAANEQVSKHNNRDNFAEAQAVANKARSLADQINKLQVQYNQYELSVANALWGEKSYAFKQSYLDTIHQFYHSGFFPVDFQHDTEGARKRINGWVEEQTHNRIKDMIPAGNLDALVRLVLTNAIYFKGEWAEVFPKEATKDDDFLLGGGKKQRVPLMAYDGMKGARYAAFQGDGAFFDTPQQINRNENDAKKLYPDDSGFQLLELPYKGGEVSMVVLVPRSADGLATLEKKLNRARLQGWIDKMANRKVHVFLPKFKLTAEYDMVNTLKQMGMVRAFVNPLEPKGAQFDGMSASTDPAQQLYVSKVLHKTFVEVNEKGTEAAAATAVIMRAASAPPVSVPFTPVFKADRPFLFLIRDVKTGGIYFVGRLLHP
jgi:serine protease inhibitor